MLPAEYEVLNMDKKEAESPLFSNRALAALTVPIILDALLAIMAGMVDSVMVSSAGEAAVSAVSLVDSLNLLFISAFYAITSGGSVVVAQYMGHRDYKNASTCANQLFYAATAIATGLMLVLLCLREPLLHWVYGHIEADVFHNSTVYFFFTLLGYPFAAMGASSTAVLRAMGKNRQAVTVSISTNMLNVVGNAVLIYGFRLGVAGAAISTTFSRVVFAVLGLTLAHKRSLPAQFRSLLKFRLDFGVMRRVMRIGATNGLESSLFYVGKLLIASLVSSFGTVYIAANSVSGTINNIGWTIIGSFGTVLLTVVGQCIGAGKPEQARANTRKMLTVATVAMTVLFSVVFLLRHQLVLLFDFGADALEAAAYYTGAAALFSIFSLYSFAFVPLNAFRAAGDIRYSVTLSITSMFAFRVALSYLLNILFPTMGLMCVFVGMWADWIFRAVLNLIRFRSGKWLHEKMI